MNSPRDPDTWRPLPAQERALRSPAYELLYGGAAGGGKSDFLVVAPLRWVDLAASRAILFRRSYPELERTLIARSREIYPRLGARYHEQRHEWTFPSGARVAFGYLERVADADRYQGAEFSFIGFDELTHFEEHAYRYMTSRLRSADGVPLRIRATTNPGGDGHEWVRARWGEWIGKAPTAKPCELRWYAADGSRAAAGDLGALARTFAPARLDDNPYLGPEYRAQLAALDPVTRAQLLDGDWDACVGEGKLFHRDWWVRLDEAPAVRRSVRAWDFGATAKGDPTRGVKIGDRGVGAEPRFVVLDVVTVRGAPHEVRAEVKATAMRDGHEVPVVIPQDPGQAGIDQALSYRRDLAGWTVRARRPSASKIVRAGPFSSQVGARNVGVMRAPWADGFVAELHAFPDGAHDDQVDAASDAFAELSTGIDDAELDGLVDDLTGAGRRESSSLLGGALAMPREDDDDFGWGARRE